MEKSRYVILETEGADSSLDFGDKGSQSFNSTAGSISSLERLGWDMIVFLAVGLVQCAVLSCHGLTVTWISTAMTFTWCVDNVFLWYLAVVMQFSDTKFRNG